MSMGGLTQPFPTQTTSPSKSAAAELPVDWLSYQAFRT